MVKQEKRTFDGKRDITMNDWATRLSMQELASAEACGVPPDFWIIADTHFGDLDINGYTGRPADAEERIVASWRALVTDDEVVVHLGDLTLLPPDEVAPLVSALPGRLLLLLGNHDHPEAEPYERMGIGIIPPFSLSRGDWTVAFTHSPHPELVAPFVLRDDGRGMLTFTYAPHPELVAPPHARCLNVHGHIHAPLAPDLRCINACVEWTGYAPIRAGEIIDARIAALAHAPAGFESPLPYDAWLAREYGGPIQLSDLTRFSDARSRVIARDAYARYRYAVLAAALGAGAGAGVVRGAATRPR